MRIDNSNRRDIGRPLKAKTLANNKCRCQFGRLFRIVRYLCGKNPPKGELNSRVRGGRFRFAGRFRARMPRGRLT
ncbi:hypothetical protein Y027_5582 [Burkholderia pseudomallei TSV5]|nr:hypothetical protein X941_5676 [Burkholderia pseudomallei MSHR5569]KGX49971.1 hypothetical protein Y027_5582 [Burkholderia pseudomallei TSV5]